MQIIAVAIRSATYVAVVLQKFFTKMGQLLDSLAYLDDPFLKMVLYDTVMANLRISVLSDANRQQVTQS